MRRLRRLMMIGVGLVWSYAAMAVELTPTVSLHGYVGVTGARSETNPWLTQRTLDRWDWADHEAGLTLNWAPSLSTRLTASVVSRRRGDIENGEPKLQVLSLNHVMQSDRGDVWGVRLGRVKNTLVGLYSNQSVPSERDGVIPPLFYQGGASEALEAMDGAGVYGEWGTDAGDQFEWQLYGGMRHDLNLKHQEYALFGGDAPGKVTEVRLVGMKLLWMPAAYPNLVFSTSLVDVSETFGQGQSISEAQQKALSGACSLHIAPCITDYDMHLKGWVLSGRGVWGRWSVTAEAAIADLASKLYVIGMPKRLNETIYTGYLQLGYTPMRKLQLWLRGEALSFSKRPRLIANPYIHYTHALTLAGRYYLTPNWFVTAQASFYDGTNALTGFRNLLHQPPKRRWSLYLLNLTYQF